MQPKHRYIGLSPTEVEESRRTYGANLLTPPVSKSAWAALAVKFREPIIVILLIALALSFCVSGFHFFMQDAGIRVFFEPVGILLAVLLATGVAFYFEQKAKQEFDLLNRVNDDIPYKIIRSGQVSEVLKRDIVAGDIVILETGEEVPADGQLLEAVSLQINESSLTGEPIVHKSCDQSLFDAEATYPTDYVCRGSSVMDGHGIFCVKKVGDATEYGSVFEGAQLGNDSSTPLSLQLDRLAKTIARFSYLIAGLVVIGRTLMYFADLGDAGLNLSAFGEYMLATVMIAVTVIVVSVPEGLPMSVTLSLAYSMRRMLKTNNLVRRMHACETMGAATVICTDKTGTLTENRMQVAETAVFGQGSAKPQDLALDISVNSTAYLDMTDPHVVKALGNPTEGALLLWLQASGIDYLALRENAAVLAQLTFSTERKYMATVVRSPQSGKSTLYVKGAPEILLGFCTTLTPETRSFYETRLADFQGRAMRTIAFAKKELSSEKEIVFANGRLCAFDLDFLAVSAISDPVRAEVPAAIRSCLDAGIAVKIVTGDTSRTAIEIARQVGLWPPDCSIEENHMTGVEFAALSDDQIKTRLADLIVLSRARPADKSRLVTLLRAEGEVVAVTGDGTNDAPALAAASVGLSMGDGTAVAKEAGDITITDNSFAGITRAVMWGRSLYINIRRFILFQMTINVAACLIVLIGAFLGTESPLSVTQMLWVNLIMDTFAALALASLPPDKNVLRDKPRNSNAHIVTPSMAHRIFGTGGLFVLLLFMLLQGFKHADVTDLTAILRPDFWGNILNLRHVSHELSPYELSLFFSFFVFLQFWNLFNARSYHSGQSALRGLVHCKKFLAIALVIAGGQVLITSIGGGMFSVVPLSLQDWVILVLATALVLILGELTRIPSRFHARAAQASD